MKTDPSKASSSFFSSFFSSSFSVAAPALDGDDAEAASGAAAAYWCSF